MKKLTLILSTVLMLLMSASCRRADDNGKLDGYWKVTEVYNIADGTTTEPDYDFIAVQLELIVLEKHNPDLSATGRLYYQKGDNDLSVSFQSNASEQLLSEFGIPARDATLQIEKLSGSELVLTSAIARISCRKY